MEKEMEEVFDRKVREKEKKLNKTELELRQKLKASPTCFDKTVVFTKQRQIKWEIFFYFCGLLREAGASQSG